MSLSRRKITLREVSTWVFDAAPAGPSIKLPVLLLHGFADAGSTWATVAEALLATGRRVIAPDLRGFGESDWVGKGGYYHFPDYVADVDALVRQLGLGSLVLVGHSMGGTVATLYAGSRPEKIERLALLEGLGPPDNEAGHAPDRMRQWLEDVADGGRGRQRTMSPEDARKRLGRQHPGVPTEALERQLPHLMIEEEGAVRWRMDPLHRTTAPMPFFAPVFRAFAGRVRCPVLLLDGGSEGYHPADEAERAAAFARGEARTIEGAGHMMHWTRPDEVAAELVRFLEGAP